MAKSYQLRPEQQAAVDQTYQYWQQHRSQSARQYLWNAKPRFGKTLATYDFAQKIQAQRILIITNRPAVSDSWTSDFFHYLAPETDYIFASAKPSAKPPACSQRAARTEPAKPLTHPQRIYSRAELVRQPALLARPLIFFISLQDIKGKDLTSQDFKAKNQWIFDIPKGWDLLIIDEGHEGIKTSKTSAVLKNLNADFTLYLSGTPFRALADQDFATDQIFNWTYLDEQKSYQDRPHLDFCVCSLSDFLPISQTPSTLSSAPSNASQKPDSLQTSAFDLSELFQTSDGNFTRPDLVRIWLDHLAQLFRSHPDLRHTFWLLSKINACRSLQKLLAEHPFFRNYQVILAAGKSPSSDNREYSGQKILTTVRSAITNHPTQTKTITLSCGQLTTGITLPEWTAIFMLYSTNDLFRLSSAQYLQAAFRAQTPASDFPKPTAYIFDFSPDRALTVLQDYAKNLCGLSTETALPELLKYLRVHSFDAAGKLSPLQPVDVLELPRQIIAREIVDSGFIGSNKLFNLQNIFHMSEGARKVISKFSALHKNRLEKSPKPLPVPTVELDAANRPLVNVEFINQAFQEVLKSPKYRKLSRQNRQKLRTLALLELAGSSVPSSASQSLENQPLSDQSPAGLSSADEVLLQNALREITTTAHRLAHRRKKREENDYRDKLRGFSRTIPMLLHDYGESDFTFADFADKIPDQPFLELTSITKNDFDTLRREQYFNELNCNLAIREFMRRETQLSTYFLPDQNQNIFDFIPLQYGSRVFTPKPTAEQLISVLRSARPELFHSRNYTFFDPAAKSGLFLALILKELYQNLRSEFRSDHDCLLHILTHQLYAWSPDAVSHRTATQTILSFIRARTVHFSDDEIQAINQHFLCFNPLSQKAPSPKRQSPPKYFSQKELSQKGGINYEKIQSNIQKLWGTEMKFNVIISNPPYQLGRRQIYADFYRLAVDLDPDLLCMVFPQGWQKPQNHNGLGQLNCAKYKRDSHIVYIDNYDQKSAEKLFPGVGTGGVNIVLRDRNFDNHGQIPQRVCGEESSAIILPLKLCEIAKPAELTPLIEQFKYLPKIESLGSARKPYGFYADPLRHPEKYHLSLSETAQNPDDVRLFGLFSDGSRGFRYVARTCLPKVSPNLDRYKLFVPKAWGNMATNIGLGGSFSNICVAAPGDACSETFIEFGPFASRDETIIAAKYFMTRFFRALLFLAKDSQNTARDKYRYIPLPDFQHEIWREKISNLDQKLFDLYDIAEPTREFILQNLQPRSESNIEIL